MAPVKSQSPSGGLTGFSPNKQIQKGKTPVNHLHSKHERRKGACTAERKLCPNNNIPGFSSNYLVLSLLELKSNLKQFCHLHCVK